MNDSFDQEVAAETPTETLEKIIPMVILGQRASFPLELDLGDAGKTTVNIRWPSIDDEAVIDSLAATYHNVRWDELPPEAQFLAKARATLEHLAVKPYPLWLPSRELPGQGLRPNTGAVKSRALLGSFYRRFVEVYSTFQKLAF